MIKRRDLIVSEIKSSKTSAIASGKLGYIDLWYFCKRIKSAGECKEPHNCAECLTRFLDEEIKI